MKTGDILGHEFMGVVEEVGAGVTRSAPGRPRGDSLRDRLRRVLPLPAWPCSRRARPPIPARALPEPEGHPLRRAALFGYSHLYGGYPAGRPSSCACRRPTSGRCDSRCAVRRAGAVPVRHPADRLPGRDQCRGREARLHGGDLRCRSGRADERGVLPAAGRGDDLHGRPSCRIAWPSRSRPTA